MRYSIETDNAVLAQLEDRAEACAVAAMLANRRQSLLFICIQHGDYRRLLTGVMPNEAIARIDRSAEIAEGKL